MPSDGYCRFSACKQSGLYFKRLDKHLKRCHPGKSKKDNMNCPSQNPVDRPLVKTIDRPRQPCTVHGCRYYGVPISRLDRHVKKIHETKPNGERNQDLVVEFSFAEDEDDDSFSAKIAGIVENLWPYNRVQTTASLEATISEKVHDQHSHHWLLP